MREFMRHTMGEPMTAAVAFAGCFLFVFVCCLLHYREEKNAEKKKDTLIQWLTLDSLFAIGFGLAVWMI